MYLFNFLSKYYPEYLPRRSDGWRELEEIERLLRMGKTVQLYDIKLTMSAGKIRLKKEKKNDY